MKLYKAITLQIDSLTAEEPLLATRLQNEAKIRAKNVATSYINKHELTQATLLFLDFSGLRTIPEPKENVISHYYNIVERNSDKRNGVKLYGGKDGDDAFTFLFVDPIPAIQCVKDIKKEFSEDLFLAPSGDIKFGLCSVPFESEKREERIIQCWGTAKDCCEFKGSRFRNRGDLIVSAETLDFLKTTKGEQVSNNFVEITDEHLKNDNKSKIYRSIEVHQIQQ